MSGPAASSRRIPTPGQTVGPFSDIGLPYAGGPQLVADDDPRAVRLHGYLYDGQGDPVPDGLLEIWQADERGEIPQTPGSLSRAEHAFTGFGRAATDAVGHYQFQTVLPGVATSAPDAAPFIALAVFSRGLNDKLHTRIYLPDYADLNAADPLLAGLSAAERATLFAVREVDGALRHDIHLQGEQETVFLAFT
jgi:protocatechuate 3,4-dioxygenase, alpha subunit